MTGMSLIVKAIVRFLIGFIFVFSMSVVLYGHITPGGGFAGGVMLACGLILFLLAFGKEETIRIIRETAAGVLDSVGALAFLAIALLGFVSGRFFLNFLPKGEEFHLFSGGTLLWCNIAIGIKVGAALFAVYVALAVFRMSGKAKENGERS
jgi:multicomponent Na+:H+ antiporter subunit B